MKVTIVVLWENEKNCWNEKIMEWNIDMSEDEVLNGGAGDGGGDGEDSDWVMNIEMI